MLGRTDNPDRTRHGATAGSVQRDGCFDRRGEVPAEPMPRHTPWRHHGVIRAENTLHYRRKIPVPSLEAHVLVVTGKSVVTVKWLLLACVVIPVQSQVRVRRIGSLFLQ